MDSTCSSLSSITDRYRFRKDLGLLFDYRSGIFHRLENDVAKNAVAQLFEGKSRDEIVATVCAEYDVDELTAAEDFERLISSLSVESQSQVSCEFYSVDKGFEDLLTFPIRLEIEVTALCNWDCGFCYNVWKIDPTLSDREVKQLIKQMPMKHLPKEAIFKVLDEGFRKGCMVVRYSGGETMLHPDIMEILEYGADRKMYQVLFTNGHFLSEDVVERLVRCNVRTVLISLHGGRDKHNALTGRRDAYEKALKAIDLCVKEGIEVVVEMTLLRENLGEVLSTVQSVYERGVREFRVMRYVPTGRKDAMYAVSPAEILPLMRDLQELQKSCCPGVKIGWPCGQKFCTSEEDVPLSLNDPSISLRFEQLTGHCESGLVWGSISHDGQVRNCPHSNVYHGSILSEELQSSWQRMTARVGEVLRRRDSCTGCEVFGVCRGGCHLPHFLSDNSGSEKPISIGRSKSASQRLT